MIDMYEIILNMVKNYSKGVETIDINLKNNNIMNDKINLITENKIFAYNLRKIEELENNRKFCLHDMQHFLDVARLMYIMSLERNLNLPRYMIYTTALLHDIGRGEQYEKGTAHHIASVKIAKEILEECKYNDKEINEILEAIGNHRNSTEEINSLSDLLYKCDKLSRNCLNCAAIDDCKWTDEKKNLNITY